MRDTNGDMRSGRDIFRFLRLCVMGEWWPFIYSAESIPGRAMNKIFPSDEDSYWDGYSDGLKNRTQLYGIGDLITEATLSYMGGYEDGKEERLQREGLSALQEKEGDSESYRDSNRSDSPGA